MKCARIKWVRNRKVYICAVVLIHIYYICLSQHRMAQRSQAQGWRPGWGADTVGMVPATSTNMMRTDMGRAGALEPWLTLSKGKGERDEKDDCGGSVGWGGYHSSEGPEVSVVEQWNLGSGENWDWIGDFHFMNGGKRSAEQVKLNFWSFIVQPCKGPEISITYFLWHFYRRADSFYVATTNDLQSAEGRIIISEKKMKYEQVYSP